MKVISILLIYFSCHVSLCCTCMTFPTEIDSEMVMNRDYEIFVGKIITKSVQYFGKHPYFIYTVKVKNKYTLNSTEKYVTLRTPTQGSACGFRFYVGRTYLITVHTNSDGNGIRDTSMCLRNVIANKATEELKLMERVIKNCL